MQLATDFTFDMTSLKLHQLIERSCNNNMQRQAVSDHTTNWTYAELWQKSLEVEGYLKKAGLQPYEPVILTVNNECLDMAFFIAIWRAGGTAVPLHKNSTAQTWENLIAITTARYVLNPSDREISLETLTSVEYCLYKTETTQYVPDLLLNDSALVVFTSGTTGSPKGVVQGHSEYVRKLYSLYSTIQPLTGLLTLQYLQLSFSFGQWTSFLTLILGGHLILRSKFTAGALQADLNSFGTIHWAPMVPSMLRIFLAEFTEPHSGAVVIGHLLVGGEIMPAALGKKVIGRWPGVKIIDIYGLTETNSGDMILQAEEYQDNMGSIGFPTRGVAFRITDGDKQVLPGETGELEIASTFRMKGYLRNPGLTNGIMNGDYLRTGDMGFIDEKGMVRLVGRRTDQINTGGRKVSPVEIEEIYILHKDVLACLAGAAPDSLLGEVPVLLVIPRQGAAVTEEALREWGKTRIEHYKIPACVLFVEALPLGRTGKADRSQIKNIRKLNENP
jgi:long-chain acyl-CoA synthetase